MKKLIFVAIPFFAMVSCTQESESSDQMTLRAQKEQALIAKGVQSLRIASFYIPDNQDASTKELAVAPESLSAFAKKSALYQSDGSLKSLTPSVAQHYQEFVKANLNDPRLRRFKREAAADLLIQGQSLKTADKAFFTTELIANRSDKVALLCSSVRDLRGKISAVEHEQLLRQTNTLLDQYEDYFKKGLTATENRSTATYRQRAQKAIDARYDELAIEMVRENRQLLGGD